MSNVATTKPANKALAALAGLKSSLQNVAASTPMRITEPFMRMGTDGVWVYGAENIEVEDGSQWAINPLSIRHGYSCWTNYPAKAKKKNELKGEVMVPASQAKPTRDTLQTHTDAEYGDWEWKDQVSFSLMCVSGEDKGVTVLYKTSSVGGLNACGELIAAILAQLEDDPDNPVPSITLGSESYTHKTYGKTYTPDLTIVAWHGLPDNGMVDVQAEQDETEEKAETPAEPARRRAAPVKAKPQPVAEEEEEEEDEEQTEVEETPATPVRRRASAAAPDEPAPAPEVRRRRTRG